MADERISYPEAGGEISAGADDFGADGALTRDFLLRRGRCCREGCRHCPYGFGKENNLGLDPA